MKKKVEISNEAKKAFNSYKDVKVTWPMGATKIINRKQLEEMFGSTVTAYNLNYGYPGCTISAI